MPTDREALAGISFAIDDGEMAFLTGPSGAGKSSVLKLIALIERPTRGQVFIGHQNTVGIKPRGIPFETPAVKPRAWFARHAQTLIGSWGRIARYPIGALLTMAVIALALPLSLTVFLQNTYTATVNWNQVRASVLAWASPSWVVLSASAGSAPKLAATRHIRYRSHVSAI
jgi:energy-coupling factor transporter ATP-binding protein EcfA2